MIRQNIKPTLLRKQTISSSAILIWLILFLFSCHPSIDNYQTNDPSETITTEVQQDKLIGFSPELEMSFNREMCPVACWYGLMLGQTEAEALNAIRMNPHTQGDMDIQEGDFIRIERFEDNLTVITWLSTTTTENIEASSVSLKDGLVTGIVARLTERVLFQGIINELGEPDSVGAIPHNTNDVEFTVGYLEQGVVFGIEGVGNPASLEGESEVTSLIFLAVAEIEALKCSPAPLMVWNGFGGVHKYYESPDIPLYGPTPGPECH